MAKELANSTAPTIKRIREGPANPVKICWDSDWRISPPRSMAEGGMGGTGAAPPASKSANRLGRVAWATLAAA
jgi:hypothetical protein